MTKSFKLSLDDVDPWKAGGVILGPGTHPVKVVDEEIDLDGDHPVVKVQLEAIGGEEEGGEIRDWIHVTEKTLGRIAQIYEAFRVEVPAGEFEWIPIKGKQAKAIVRREDRRDGKTDDKGNIYKVSEVKAYVAIGADEATVEKIKDEFGATEVGSGGGKDDDIPF